MRLTELGWDDGFAGAFNALASGAELEPGRVAIEFNHIYRVSLESGDCDARLSGRLKHRARRRSELPAVGDWVVLRRSQDHEHAAIHAVLPRRSAFSRRMAGQVTDEQVVAANVDVLFVVMGLDADFNVRRLERYLLLAREGGAAPVVLLTKPDLSADVSEQTSGVRALAGTAPVHVLSPKRGDGLDQLTPYLTRGRTATLVGSSGAGKSTIINRLAGAEVRRTREVRPSDARGRHTTTHRELIILPGGALIIDTPGMRELQLWDVGEAVRQTFDDIEALVGGCRFGDCRHRGEPGCAVRGAIEDGQLDEARLGSYLKLQDELAALAADREIRLQREERRASRTSKIRRRSGRR